MNGTIRRVYVFWIANGRDWNRRDRFGRFGEKAPNDFLLFVSLWCMRWLSVMLFTFILHVAFYISLVYV